MPSSSAGSCCKIKELSRARRRDPSVRAGDAAARFRHAGHQARRRPDRLRRVARHLSARLAKPRRPRLDGDRAERQGRSAELVDITISERSSGAVEVIAPPRLRTPQRASPAIDIRYGKRTLLRTGPPPIDVTEPGRLRVVASVPNSQFLGGRDYVVDVTCASPRSRGKVHELIHRDAISSSRASAAMAMAATAACRICGRRSTGWWKTSWTPRRD